MVFETHACNRRARARWRSLLEQAGIVLLDAERYIKTREDGERGMLRLAQDHGIVMIAQRGGARALIFMAKRPPEKMSDLYLYCFIPAGQVVPEDLAKRIVTALS